MGLKLDWLGEDQRTFLKRGQGYLKKGESPEQRYEKIAQTIEDICERNGHIVSPEYTTVGIGDRFRTYIEEAMVSFSSPVLANFGDPNNLPISCNHGKIDDTLDSILDGATEMGMLAKYGAGTAKNFSLIRAEGEPISTGGKSEGIMPWIEHYASTISKVTQGAVRRGFLTAYLSVDHPQILEFLDIGTERYAPISNDVITALEKMGIDTKQLEKIKSQMQGITTAVTLPKGWRQSLKAGDPEKRKIWAKILKNRSEMGYPYILDEENCNINHPQVYKDKGMWIDSANICIEAIEYCSPEKEFACCLSSANVLKMHLWDEHKFFLKDMYIMLDCVITEYIEKGKELFGLEKAVRFAEEHRAIGLGILGFHDLLQSKMVAFGSLESHQLNYKIFSTMRSEAEIISKIAAEAWGEPEILKGYGQRWTSKLAQAPTKSTSFIMGMLSSGIEPNKSNHHEKDLAKIMVEYKNRFLKELLAEKGQDTRKVWRSILEMNGSVQHLDFLTDHEKDVFKTFSEISQMDILKLAASRQRFIDMGQSLNLMIHPKTPPKEINKLILEAFDMGIKSLYYQYSINAAQELNQDLMECSSCEG